MDRVVFGQTGEDLVSIPSNGSSLFQWKSLHYMAGMKSGRSQSPQTGQVYFNLVNKHNLLVGTVSSQSPQTGQVYFNGESSTRY